MANWHRCKYEEVGYYFFNADFAKRMDSHELHTIATKNVLKKF